MRNIFPLLLMLSPFVGYGQDDEVFLGTPEKDKIVKVIHSDKFVKKGSNISILSGNVLMRIDGTTTEIKCDSAIIDYEKYVLLAYGKVVLSNSTEQQVKYSSIKLDLNKAKRLVLGKDRIGSK